MQETEAASATFSRVPAGRAPHRRFRYLSTPARHLGTWLLWGAGLGTIGGSLARLWSGLELMCHFRVQYLAALVVAGVLLGLARAWRHAVAAVVLVVWNGALILPLYFPAAVPPAAPGDVSWRLAVANVFAGNRSPERVVEFLRAEQPDVVVIPELTPAWERRVEQIEDLFPYLRVESREGAFGIGLYSRAPIESADIIYVAGGSPAIVARLQKEGQTLTVIGGHPYPPGGSQTKLRDRQLRDLAERAANIKGPCVLMGDLNTTSWSPAFQACVEISHLRDSRKGFGVQPSWPAGRAVLRIPIDHCLVSDDIVVTGRRIGPDVGSDHFPVLIDCRVRAVH